MTLWHRIGEMMDLKLSKKNFYLALESVANWRPVIRKKYLENYDKDLEPLKIVICSLIKIYEINPPYKTMMLENLLNEIYHPMNQGKKINAKQLKNSKFEL